MDYKEQRQFRKKLRRKKILKRIATVITVILLVIGGFTAYVSYQAIKAAKATYHEKDKSTLREKKVEYLKEPFSVLLMGIEDYSTGGKNGRTDSLMYLTIDPKNKTTKITSIPRDTYTYIKVEGKKDKINHAHAFGGTEATIDAVEKLLNSPIDFYAKINFAGFKELIDATGGVDVEVPFDFTEKNERGKWLQFSKGQMHLNGEQALAYARMRKQDPNGDFGRQERQQQIISAVVEKLTKPQVIFKIDEIANALGKNIETNMRISQALGLQKQFTNFSSTTTEHLTIDGEGQTINGIWYYVPDETSLNELIHKLRVHLKLDKPTEEDVQLENKSSSE